MSFHDQESPLIGLSNAPFPINDEYLLSLIDRLRRSTLEKAARSKASKEQGGGIFEILDLQSSRYNQDFDEVAFLGKGGFGQVVRSQGHV